MKLEITATPSQEDDNLIIDKTREYNKQFVENKFELLSIYIRNDSGDIIGGLTGKTFWNWLHVDFLWVSETERENDLGSQIMQAAESEAIERGCIGSTLDTFSFQALGFYQKLGYEVIGTLSGYSDKYERHYLKKQLTSLG